MVELLTALLGVLLAVCLGGLIGLEREYWRKKKHMELPFGIRTTILISLIGLIFVFLGEFIDINVSIALGLVTVLILVVSNYFTRSRSHLIGMTSYFAIIISFLIGLLVGFSQYLVAVIISVVTTGFLTVKHELHGVVKLMNLKEIRSTIEFAALAFIILPLMPDAYIDPFKVFNPFRFWLTVILVAGISFFSYITLRIVKNGLAVTGFLGGFISSKLTVNSLAIKVRLDKNLRQDAFNGMILSMASNISFCILISLFNYNGMELFNYVFLPLFISTAVMLLIFHKNTKGYHHEVKYDNPFSIVPALKFAFLLFIFIQAVTLTSEFINPNLVYVIILLSSLVSVYASVASISSLMASGSINFMLGVNLFVFACVISLLDKIIFVKSSRDKKLISKMIAVSLSWTTLIICILIIENYLAVFI